MEYLTENRYNITLDLIIDCENGNPQAFWDDPVVVGMYEKGTNRLVTSFWLPLVSGVNDTVPIKQKDCSEPIDFCMFIAGYELEIEADEENWNHSQGYYLSWERCCRNSVVSNIIDAGSKGITFYTEIPPFSIKNSTPEFNNLPLTILCVGDFFRFKFDIDDRDGDSVYISLAEPLTGYTNRTRTNAPTDPSWPQLNAGPYATANWEPPYSLNNIMGGNPPLRIDNQNGLASVGPTREGFFVFAVRVEEFRNGLKIGEIRRELQYTVVKCDANNSPKIKRDEVPDSLYTLYPGRELNFEFFIEDPDDDSVFLEIKRGLLNRDIIGSPAPQITTERVGRNIRLNFSWEPSCQQISDDSLYLDLIYRDNGCPFAKTGQFQITFLVKEPPLLPPPEGFCAKRLSDSSLILEWKWPAKPKNAKGILVERSLNDGFFEKLATLNKNEGNTFIDSDATDNNQNNFCYRLSTLNYCGSKGDSTYELCSVDDIGVVPQPVFAKYATVDSQEYVQLFWQESIEKNFKSYYLYKSINGSPFAKVDSIQNRATTNWIDINVNPDSNSYAYLIEAIDNCLLQSEPGDTLKTILLTGNSSPYEHELEWFFNPNPNGSNWQLEKAPIGLPFAQQAVGLNMRTHLHELNRGDSAYWKYRMSYQDLDSGWLVHSNTIELLQRPKAFIPNVFTPDGNGLNDSFNYRIDFVRTFHIQIYNRWGQLVFESNDPMDFWDGMDAMDGAYIFKMIYRSGTGRITFKTGRVNLIR